MGTQLAASAVTGFSADPTQRRIMFALPFVFTVFIINFQAGLIVYWITTNMWTIGQQLVVKKLYPQARCRRAPEGRAKAKTARGKPPRRPSRRRRGRRARRAARQARAPRPAAERQRRAGKAPPQSPRKKEKRSGRRR